MATAQEVISTLHSRGVTLEPDGAGGLRVNGISRLADREKAALRAHKGAILKALAADPAVSTDPTSPAPVAASPAVTEPLPDRTELLEPDRAGRRCYMCASFDRSPFGFPLGTCRYHGDRIQHSDSEPARFGCGFFDLRAPDSRACTACQNYNPVSTMCRVVNLGCPLPHIPPCRGESFEPNEVRS